MIKNTHTLFPPRNQIFEWWYFRKYGTSFIEQVSLNHLSPWIGGGDALAAENAAATANNNNNQQSVPGTKWRVWGTI